MCCCGAGVVLLRSRKSTFYVYHSCLEIVNCEDDIVLERETEVISLLKWKLVAQSIDRCHAEKRGFRDEVRSSASVVSPRGFKRAHVWSPGLLIRLRDDRRATSSDALHQPPQLRLYPGCVSRIGRRRVK